MARPKKPGRRARGIQGRQGYLYIIHNKTVYRDGEKKTIKQWIPTLLEDIPENIPKAQKLQNKVLHKQDTDLDINISVSDYLDYYITYKKRSWTDTTYCNYLNRGKYITEYLGAKKMREISVSDVECFLDQLCSEKKFQSRSIKDIRSFLKGFLT